MQVQDIMTRQVEVVQPSATLAEAAERMRAIDIGVLPVMESDNIVGVVTDRDMAVRAIAQGLDPRTVAVADVMTREVRSCFDDQSVEEAAAEMAESGLRRLIVLDRNGHLAGIVSLDDVATCGVDVALVGKTLGRTAPRRNRPLGRYERILVALDGSGVAEDVLASITPLAQKFGSRVTLLRAVTPVRAPATAEVGVGVAGMSQAPAPSPPRVEDLRRDATDYLSRVESRLNADGLTVESECPEGSAGDVILRRARQLGVDLIALTTHGRTHLDRLLLGSVAEHVVRRAPCPVLLVRVPTDAKSVSSPAAAPSAEGRLSPYTAYGTQSHRSVSDHES